MLGELNQQEIDRLLRTQQIGRLGVTDGERVYVFPVCYGYDGASLYLVSRMGLKVQLMRAHPEVCLEVEQIESPAHWRTVMVHGCFEEVAAPEERDAALALTAAQGDVTAPWSIAPYLGGPEEMIVYRIRLQEMTGRFERDEVFRPAQPSEGRPQTP
jgi:nitroimidazol reductase NimA-like FMN-containing flavoprotein (pyridoxamine 5'-phosphate oxidase superfamily)